MFSMAYEHCNNTRMELVGVTYSPLASCTLHVAPVQPPHIIAGWWGSCRTGSHWLDSPQPPPVTWQCLPPCNAMKYKSSNFNTTRFWPQQYHMDVTLDFKNHHTVMLCFNTRLTKEQLSCWDLRALGKEGWCGHWASCFPRRADSHLTALHPIRPGLR
jgi:hypothetical protein